MLIRGRLRHVQRNFIDPYVLATMRGYLEPFEKIERSGPEL